MAHLEEEIDSVLQIKAKDYNIPLSVFIDLTRKCNQNCEFCYAVDEQDRELSLKEWKSIVDQLEKAKTMYLNFTGGEVFTRKDFLKILEYASNRFIIKILSNGSSFNENIIQQLKNLNINKMSITILGSNSKTHDFHTGLKGSFNKLMSNLKLLKKYNITTQLKTLITKYNYKEYSSIKSIADFFNFEHFVDPFIVFSNDGSSNPLSFKLTQDQFLEFCKESKINLFEKIDLDKEKLLRSYPCNAGVIACTILPNGEVCPCTKFPLKLGNLRKQDFIDIWRNSFELKKIRNFNWKDRKKCFKCDLISYCTFCYGSNYLKNRNIYIPSVDTCKEAIILKEVSDEIYKAKDKNSRKV